MKKFLIISFTLLVIIFVFCFYNDSITEKRTEDINVRINYSLAVPAKQTNTTRHTNSSLSIATEPIKNEIEQFKMSPIVIRGKVITSNYILYESDVFTKSEVEVITSYKGDLKEGQIIKIREIGGFIPSDIFDSAVYGEKFGGEFQSKKKESVIYDIRVENNKVMETGEDVILFVYPINYSDIEDFKTDSYQLLRAWQGKLLFNEEYGVYAPYIPENELPYVRARSYTLEEFENLVSEQLRAGSVVGAVD